MASGDDGLAAGGTIAVLGALEDRLEAVAPSRLGEALGVVARHLHEIVAVLRPTPAELQALVDFLTETGHHTDARRQEWVLLSDALGLSSAIQALARAPQSGGTAHMACGPFYRSGAPDIAMGQSICRDGRGETLRVGGTVRSAAGAGIGGARLDVWQANAEGLYENQEPDQQPDFNLRGRLRADPQGRFSFYSIRPGGYSLPVDGPVGRLLKSVGLPLERPAHINLRVSAEGFETLTTQVFDGADPAIDRDAIFGVRPELLGHFHRETTEDGRTAHSLEINLVLCPCGSAQPMPGRSST